jgi:hypothetical protein
MNGEIFFNMREQQHPISGSTKFLLKRWTRYTVYSKSGSYVRASYLKSGSYGWDGKQNTGTFPPNIAHNYVNNPHGNVVFRQGSPLSADYYQTCSIYLYDYVVVNDKFYYDNVYTASSVDGTPSVDGDYVPTNTWRHQIYTFKNSPNAITNNYVYAYNEAASAASSPQRSIFGPGIVYRDDGVYFEIVKGYPRNHFIHKRDLFSLYSLRTFGMVNRTVTSGSYVRNRQTISTTVGPDGLEDGTPPVQSVQVGNLKLVQTDNVINH